MATVGSLSVFLNLGGIAAFSRGLANTRDQITGLASSVTNIAGAFVGLSFNPASLVAGAFQSYDALGDLSQIVGITVDQLGGLQYAAKLAGVENEAFATSISKFTQNIGDAAQGGGSAAVALAKMGISIAEIRKDSPDELFLAVADRISKIENPAMRAALANDLFGKSGLALIPTLAQGRAGLQAMIDEYISFGGATTAQVAQLKEADDAIQRAGVAMKVFAGKALFLATPAIIATSAAAVAAVKAFQSLDPATAAAATTFGKYAIALAAAVTIAPRVVSALASIGKMLKSIATGQAIVQALSGPGGWATLAVGAAVAAGAIYGIDRAMEAAAGSGEKQAAAHKAVATQQAVALPVMNSVTSAITAQKGAIESLSSEFEAINMSIGRTSEQMKLFQLWAAGADAGTLEFAKSMQFLRQQQDDHKSITDTIAAMQQEAHTFGFTASQMAVYKAALLGATDAERTQIAAIQDKITAQQEAAKAAAKMQQDAASIFEATRTPLEQYESQLRNLMDLLSAGAIDQETFSRAAESARQTLDKATPSSRPQFASLDSSSGAAAAAAESATLKIQGDAASQKEMQRKQTEAVVSSEKALRELVTLLKVGTV